MRPYVRLWAEMLRLSWQRMPTTTVLMFTACLFSVVATGGLAFSLRETINASARGAVRDAAVMGVATALCCGLNVVLQHSVWDLLEILSNDAGLEIRRRTNVWTAELEGLDHLEQSELLDRLEELRTNSWQVSMSFWQLVMAVRSGLQLIVTLVLLGSVSPWLLIMVPFAAIPLWSDHKAAQLISRAESQSTESFRVQRHLFQVSTRANAAKDVRVAGVGPELVRRQSAGWDSASQVRYEARVRAASRKFGGWAWFACAFATALAVVSYRAALGLSTPGDVVMVVTVASGLRQTVQQVVGRTASTLTTRTAMKSYLWLQRYVSEQVAQTVGRIPAPLRFSSGITFDHVTYRYPGTRDNALFDISVHIPPGTVVAVVGEYGSGKTTLVKLLAKFHRPDQGTITVDGIDLTEMSTLDWRSRMSAIFQDFGRIETSLVESVGLGDLSNIRNRSRVARAIREADIGPLVARLPLGMDTQLGLRQPGGVELSEGQWQRVALARAGMRDSPLLYLLDEPTASLDAPSEHAIFERQIKRAHELAERTGAITFIVSHRFSTVTSADLILVLGHGHLLEVGTHEELHSVLRGRYADLYNLQADAYRRADE